jgi:hypothetical protein
MPEDWADLDPGMAAAMVKVGIETDRGSWVAALVAAGYEVFPINRLSVVRYRERHSTSGRRSPTRSMRTCWPRSSACIGLTIGPGAGDTVEWAHETGNAFSTAQESAQIRDDEGFDAGT